VTAAFLAGVAAGYGVAVPIGAIAVLIIGLTARTSLRVGVAAALGVATADGLFALAAVLGGAAMASAIRPVAGPLRWLAAIVLLGMAAHTAVVAARRFREPVPAHDAPRVDPPTRDASGLGTPARAYAGLLALTVLNPATVMYFAALVMGRQSTGGGPLFVVGVLVASASWQLLVAAGGSVVGRVLTGPRGRLITAAASSVLIAALAGHVLLGG
jgi:arginine exporter protein ArgO